MPASLPGWQASPGPWNRATIAGVRVPGLVEVTGKLSRKDDTADVPGQDGATMTVLGYAPAEFTMNVTLWTDQHVFEYQALMLRFRPTKADKNLRDAAARAVKVSHPAVQMAGLEDLTIYEMTTPDHQGRQIHRCSISLREFIPEIKRTAGVKAVKDAKGGPIERTQSISAATTRPSVAQGAVARMTAANPDKPREEDEFE